MKKIFAICTILYLFLPRLAFAHEAYVLTAQQFHNGLQIYSTNPLGPLFDSSHLGIFLWISFFVGLSYLLVILWAMTNLCAQIDKQIRRLHWLGPLIIRVTIAVSFLFAAQINCVFGPELSLSPIPLGMLIQFLITLLAFMTLFGIFTELAALVSLVIFAYITLHYGLYLITYANYLGELIVLMLWGSRTFSFDALFFGKKLWLKNLKHSSYLETPIIRILYGIALIYAGFTIKFLHQGLTIAVYNEYYLKNFFHASAGFIAAGAGLAEIAIGLFILIGFGMRWTILISLCFITLSLLYFHEMLWPHLMLYGISFSLLINSADRFTIDHYLPNYLKKLRKKLF